MNTTQQKGHPKGLYLLFITEMWERFSYYGMRALFVLFITKALLFNKEDAAQLYGSFSGLVYLTPLLGGYISDRYWGNRRSILVGGIIMAIGQFFLFFSASYYEHPISHLLMYIGLSGLILGNGLFKPNISSMVGDLYEPHDHRKDTAFTIFYMGINLGGMLSPLVCGIVGDTGYAKDFKWGFLLAGIGMLISSIVFETFKNRYLHSSKGLPIGLKPEIVKPKEKVLQSTSHKRIAFCALVFILLTILFSINYDSFHTINNSWISASFHNADWIGSIIYACCLVMPFFIITDHSLTKIEKSRIAVIFIIVFFVIFFFMAFEQAGASLTYFAEEQTDRHIFGWEMPTSYFQIFNALFIIILAPIFALLWSFLNKHHSEPSSPTKQALGLLFLALGYLIIAFGVKDADPTVKVSMFWLINLYLFHTVGELCLSPIGLSLVNKLSPARFASLMMGVWMMSIATSNKFAGILSSYYPENNEVKVLMGYTISNLFDFFILFVILSSIAAFILFALSSLLKKMSHGLL